MPAQITPSPNPDHFGGNPVRTKRAVLVCRAGYTAPVSAVLRDPATGAPIDLTAFGLVNNQAGNSGATRLACTLREYCDTNNSPVIPCAVGVAAQGQVTLTLPSTTPVGVFTAEFFTEGAAEHFVAEMLVWFEPSHRSAGSGGMPSRDDIRTALRDFSTENELLDAVDFDDTELATALCHVVSYWNSLPPRGAQRFTTSSFPHHSYWLRGAVIHLYETAAEHYVRNSLPYQAKGGLAGDDKAKFPPYMQRAMALRQAWQADLAEQKLLDDIGDGGLLITPGLMW